jgi:hypothetical protein
MQGVFKWNLGAENLVNTVVEKKVSHHMHRWLPPKPKPSVNSGPHCSLQSLVPIEGCMEFSKR